MEPRRRRIIRGETHPPTRRDRLIVLLVSLSFFVVLIPLTRPFHGSLVGWIVMLVVIGLPACTHRKHHSRILAECLCIMKGTERREAWSARGALLYDEQLPTSVQE